MAIDNTYLYLPEKFWAKHKKCELLIQQIEEFIIDEDYNGLRSHKIELDKEIKINDNEHIFDYLLRLKRNEEHDDFIRKSLVNGLIIDVCYFIQEALICSKKKRLSVSFSLLRKPFIYHLPVFLRILFDDEFLNNFNYKDSFDVNYIKKDIKQELISKSTRFLVGAKSLTSQEIYDWIFNTEKPDSLINITNKALHLSTNRNKFNKTEIQNLNFIFTNQEDIENLWQYFYNRIPVLLLYFVEIIEPLIFAIIELPIDLYEKRLQNRIKIITDNFN